MKDKSLQKVVSLLSRDKLNKNEQWMFDNYWNNHEYEFRKDNKGKLSVHKITA